MVYEIVLATISILTIIEGASIYLFPKTTKKMITYLSKKSTNLSKIALIEIAIGFIFLIISMII